MPLGRVYPPAASYPELTVWAMPTKARSRMEILLHRLENDDPAGLLPFLRGGHWRGFLAKYPESNRLHKRMLRVSRKHRDIRDKGTSDARLGEALRDLYRGQCNDAYWHGVFGGLYLPHLRRALESALIRAERTLDRLDKGHFDWTTARLVDFDADGADEAELANPHTHLVLDPKGGRLLSWDLCDACENWVTVMQRHEEPFHEALRQGNVIYVDEEGKELDSKEAESEVSTIHGQLRVKPGVDTSDLRVDTHGRVAAIAWSAPAEVMIEDPRELDACASRLDARWDIVRVDDSGMITMHTEQHGLRVTQTTHINAQDASLEFEIEVVALQGPRRFLSEWNLFVGWTPEDLEYAKGGGNDELDELIEGEAGRAYESAPYGEEENCEHLRVRGGGDRKLGVKLSPPAHLRWAPVHTVSSSEAGLEKIGQGSCFVFDWLVEDRLRLKLRLIPSAPAMADETLDG